MVTEMWAIVAGCLSALILISNAVEKIFAAVKAAKAPNDRQDKVIAELQDWRREVDRKLREVDKTHGEQAETNRIVIQGMIALLGHGVDGNNIDEMKKARRDLQSHLLAK